jgi:dTMP kinase
MTKYVVFEGTEGVFKSTQVKLLSEYLINKGKTVLVTKEPGTPLCELSMVLRDIILNNKYSEQLSPIAREYILQAVRTIHVNNVINPALGRYDYIIQDRGIMSSIAYGLACNLDYYILEKLNLRSINFDYASDMYKHFYNTTIFLKGDIVKGHHRASSCKQEFVEGDVMELKGLEFQQKVENNFNFLKTKFLNVIEIFVEDKTKEIILDEILKELAE